MKSQANFEIRSYINLNISGSQTYNELCKIQRTSAASKPLVFRWHKNFQDGFTNHKYGFHPGQHKTIVTNVNIAAVADLTQQDARLTLKYYL